MTHRPLERGTPLAYVTFKHSLARTARRDLEPLETRHVERR